jgi:glycosyltransferase involved in cell wall biosynthesis
MTSLDDLAIAYVSLAVPDTAEFRNRALHHNGNLFMHNVLFGLRAVQSAHVEAFSAVPIPSFPESRLLIRRQRREIAPGIGVTCVPFVNITPIKQVSIGLSILWHLLAWGLRKRRQRRLVFSYNISVPPLLCTLIAARLIGAKVMAFIGDIIVPGSTVPANLLCRVDAWCETRLLKFVDGCIVVADRIAKDYLPGRSYVRVDGGVSRSLIEESGRILGASRADGSTFTIVATGTLSSFNGYGHILEAFSQLEGARYRLIIAGHGPLEPDIVAAAARDSRIEFKGFLGYSDLLALHATADVLISMRITRNFNTAYAFPSKTFEYLLSGIPVITTSTGHMKEEYGPYCFILDDESPGALRALLQKVESLGPEERVRVGRIARQFVIEHNAWEVQHKRIAGYTRTISIT